MFGSIFIIFGFVFAMVGVFVAVFIVMKMGNKGTVVTTQATVIRTYTDERYVNENFTSRTVDSSSNNFVKSYMVEFRIKGGKSVYLKSKKKVWLQIHDGDKGELVYRNQKMIGFIPKEKVIIIDDEIMTTKEKKIGLICMIYGEAKDSEFCYESNQQLEVNLLDVKKLIKQLKYDETDWFFVLSNEKGDQLQIERAPDDEIQETIKINEKEEIKIYPFKKLEEQDEIFFKL